ncbi:SIMPL domain-containing protein [Tunicatimonas pelagia]|uniref:SIMPL domain-containing protein n=1 Tax=Tunicatimonas pelagia TaxID=931531 RepID=UPI0026663301|nr:SIMPL domain-containing protein [Tunicatimonas pelagia]WKN44748.1 SIMPL domain-containing protein [Tunicatimonas pelagia]
MRQILLFFCIISAGSLLGQSRPDGLLEVVGYGRVLTSPDIGVVRVSIKEIELGYGQAIDSLIAKEQAIVDVFQSLDYSPDKIKTLEFNAGTNTSWRRGEQYDSGFVAFQTLSVEFTNDRKEIAKFINAFSRNQVEAQVSFSFQLSSTLRQTLREKAIADAINDAHSKAKIIAQQNNVNIGSIRKITYGNVPTTSSSSDYVYEELMEIPATEQPSISSQGFSVQDVVVTDRVLIIYELEEKKS